MNIEQFMVENINLDKVLDSQILIKKEMKENGFDFKWMIHPSEGEVVVRTQVLDDDLAVSDFVLEMKNKYNNKFRPYMFYKSANKNWARYGLEK